MKYFFLIILFFTLSISFSQDIEIVSDSLEVESDTARITRADSLVAHIMRNDSIDATLDYRFTDITLDDKVSMSLPKGYKWLPADQVYFVFSGILGKPNAHPYGTVIVLPTQYSVLDDEIEWMKIMHVDSGYVHEQDFSKVNFDDYLLQLQINVGLTRDTLIKYAQAPEYLVGWSTKPIQDLEKHRLDWGYEYAVTNRENQIERETRMLGRSSFVAVTGRGKKTDKNWQDAYDELVNSINFKIGFKYSDYKEESDEVYPFGTVYLVNPAILQKETLFNKYWKWGLAVILLLVIVGRRISARRSA